MKVVDLKSEYKADNDNKINISIIIGDAQIGSSIIYLENQEIGKGDIHNLEIGIGSQLIGKKLIIKSVVTDVNDMSNYTSITYMISGGLFDQTFTSKAVVDENGDSVIYRAIFSFI